MTAYVLLEVGGFILALTCFMIMLFFGVWLGSKEKSLAGLLGFVVGTILIVMGELGRYNYYEQLIDDGYNVYVDGTLIDANKIDLHNYSITINEELKELYLTPHAN